MKIEPALILVMKNSIPSKMLDQNIDFIMTESLSFFLSVFFQNYGWQMIRI